MSNNGQSNGAGGQESEIPMVPVEEVVAKTISAFAPFLNEEQAIQMALACLHENVALNQVFKDATELPAREACSHWGFQILSPKGSIGVMTAPKDIMSAAEAQDPEGIVRAAYIIAFLTSPIARGILRAYGLDVKFHQVKSTPKPLIVAPQ